MAAMPSEWSMLEHTIIEQNATAICASWFDDLSIDQTTEGRDQPLSLD